MTIRAQWLDNVLFYEESATGEAVRVIAPVSFYDDFLMGTTTSDFKAWLTRDAGAATETVVRNTANAVAVLALDATNEIQVAGIDWGDDRPWILNQGLVIEFRFRFTTLPTGSVVAVLGLCGNHNAAVNTIAESIWFRADGSGAITVETDDTVNETSQVATGVTLAANAWAIGRIVVESTAAVRFYLNGTRVASATTFNMSQVAALALQPVARIGKEVAATTVGTLQVDYVRCWQRRAA